MSIRTELTGTSRKLRLLTAVCAGVVALSASLSANAAFLVTGGSAPFWPVTGNDFTSDLNGKGFDEMTTGAQLSVTMDGSVTFYYIAAESGYTNSFISGSSIVEDNDEFKWDGWGDSITIDVKADKALDFSFTSASISALTPVDNAKKTNLHGLGTLLGSGNHRAFALAYNDNYLGFKDSDFDDMLVRAVFNSAAVPVPPIATPIPAAAWLFGSGLLGLIGMARRRKQ